MNAATPTQPARRWLFVFLCILVALGKLWLVSRNEILAINDDSAAYAHQAFTGWTLAILPPGYPMWLKLCAALAVPQRTSIELLYLLSASVVTAVARKCLGHIGGLAFFALMAFAPFTYFLLDHGWSDGFFACLTVLALGATGAILIAESAAQIIWRAAGLGLVLGLMAITRNEDSLLVFWVLALVSACAAKWPRTSHPLLAWKVWTKPLTAGLVCAAACCLVIGGICSSFYLANGVFARDLAPMPRHSRALPRSLPSIASAAMASLPGDANDAGIDRELFDLEFMRRADDIPKERKVDVQGWAFVNSPGRTIQNVVVGSSEEEDAGVDQMDRPDVDKAFLPQTGWKPHAVGFKARVDSNSADDVRITYILDDGSHVEGTHLKQMAVSKLVNTISSDRDVIQGIDYAKADSGGPSKDRARNIQDALVHFSNTAAVHFIGFILVALAVGILTKVFVSSQSSCAKSLLVLIGFALPMWCARVLFCSLIDAAAGNADQTRFLAPANALGFVIFALSVTALPQFARKLRVVK